MRDLSPTAIKDALEAGEIILIDVREPHEFNEARIRGAFNFPLSSFDPAVLPVSPGRQVILHCGTGRRSGMALDQCEKANVPVSSHMKGGITSWAEAGLPVIAVDPSTGRLVER